MMSKSRKKGSKRGGDKVSRRTSIHNEIMETATGSTSFDVIEDNQGAAASSSQADRHRAGLGCLTSSPSPTAARAKAASSHDSAATSTSLPSASASAPSVSSGLKRAPRRSATEFNLDESQLQIDKANTRALLLGIGTGVGSSLIKSPSAPTLSISDPTTSTTAGGKGFIRACLTGQQTGSRIGPVGRNRNTTVDDLALSTPRSTTAAADLFIDLSQLGPSFFAEQGASTPKQHAASSGTSYVAPPVVAHDDNVTDDDDDTDDDNDTDDEATSSSSSSNAAQQSSSSNTAQQSSPSTASPNTAEQQSTVSPRASTILSFSTGTCLDAPPSQRQKMAGSWTSSSQMASSSQTGTPQSSASAPGVAAATPRTFSFPGSKSAAVRSPSPMSQRRKKSSAAADASSSSSSSSAGDQYRVMATKHFTLAEAMKKLGVFYSEFWPASYSARILNDANFPPLIRYPVAGWEVELGQPMIPGNAALFTEFVVPSSDQYRPLYRSNFHGHPHAHFVLTAEDSKGRGPFLFSVRHAPDPDSSMLHAIVRSNLGTKGFLISSSEHNLRIALIRACDLVGVDPNKILRNEDVPDSALHRELLREEDKRISSARKFAFGLLYARGGLTENQVYALSDGSPSYQRFLRILAGGDPVVLEGWPHFKAGLDVAATRSTGTHSLYTTIDDIEIMFHVSTLLPYDPIDEQQVPRKRHIGNDPMVVVYLDGSEPFDPSIFLSHMNQSFLVVQEVPFDQATALIASHEIYSGLRFLAPQSTSQLQTSRRGTRKINMSSPQSPSASSSSSSSEKPAIALDPSQTYYRVAFTAKSGIALATPLFETPCLFSSAVLRIVLLTKLINGHRNSFAGPNIGPMYRRLYIEQLAGLHRLFHELDS